MKLTIFSAFCLAGQVVAAHIALNLVGAGGAFFFVTMAISAHIVIEICRHSSLERCRGFFVFYSVYALAEIYLFAIAISMSVDLLFPVYTWLYDYGRATMFTLTVISLLAGAITPILNNSGKAGGVVGRFIDYCYSAVLRLPYH